MTRKDYKIAIFGGIIAILSSGVYDYIKEKPILSSLKKLFIWIWENIFDFELKVWQILAGLILIAAIYSIVKASRAEEKAKFTDYRRDVIHGTEWTWGWQDNFLENKWEVTNITPLCEKCGTRMKTESGYGPELTAKCPRCENRKSGLKDRGTIEALIIDNIRQNLHLDKIKKA